ncbi:uncharacterized protein LOC103260004, partial [Carlito syrichta]|uniref:Uncharacterized protein LOC103260004 n=1 Tax=Carlito syrichta TaxID=1868482 RepID=A0A3Q0DX64_CARSF
MGSVGSQRLKEPGMAGTPDGGMMVSFSFDSYQLEEVATEAAQGPGVGARGVAAFVDSVELGTASPFPGPADCEVRLAEQAACRPGLKARGPHPDSRLSAWEPSSKSLCSLEKEDAGVSSATCGCSSSPGTRPTPSTWRQWALWPSAAQ